MSIFQSTIIRQILCIIILIVFSSPLAAAVELWIKQTIDMTINNQFDSALTIIEQRLNENPKDYQAQFYMAATLSSKMTYYENTDHERRFHRAIDSTISIVDSILDKANDISYSAQSELLFYIGSAYGYRAFYQGNQGHWLVAISNALKSVNYLSESLDKDSTMYGAYLGLGVYKYWRYSRLKVVSWLPFVPDDRDEGIQMILYAITHDPLSRYMAMHQLVYILLDYGKEDEALFFAKKIIRKYPNSQFMYWAYAHACYKSKLYAEAGAAYRYLKRLISQDPQSNLSHLIRCDYKLAEIDFELENYGQCMEKCKQIFTLSEEIALTDKGQETLSQTKDLFEECMSAKVN